MLDPIEESPQLAPYQRYQDKNGVERRNKPKKKNNNDHLDQLQAYDHEAEIVNFENRNQLPRKTWTTKKARGPTIRVNDIDRRPLGLVPYQELGSAANPQGQTVYSKPISSSFK